MMKFSFFVSLAKWVFKITMWVVFVACMDSQILDWAKPWCDILVARKGCAYSFGSSYMQIKITELWHITKLFSNLYSLVSSFFFFFFLLMLFSMV
jgi:hypothetical protein